MLKLLVLFCCIIFGYSQAQISVESIYRSSPSGNTHIIYDPKQILVVDVGLEEKDAAQTHSILSNLINEGRVLNGFFITHGHPDHCMTLWKMQEYFPGVPAYVLSSNIKTELMNLMYFYGRFVNQSSPGNPTGSAPSRYDYEKILVANSSALWNGDELIFEANYLETAETFHFATIWIPSINTLISGDTVFLGSHLNMAYDVGLTSQCDWVNLLKTYRTTYPNVTILAGHGEMNPGMGTSYDIFGFNILYILTSRRSYAQYCDPQAAAQDIINFLQPVVLDNPILLILSSAFRSPADAIAQGCDCTNNPHDICQTVPIPCI